MEISILKRERFVLGSLGPFNFFLHALTENFENLVLFVVLTANALFCTQILKNVFFGAF